ARGLQRVGGGQGPRGRTARDGGRGRFGGGAQRVDAGALVEQRGEREERPGASLGREALDVAAEGGAESVEVALLGGRIEQRELGRERRLSSLTRSVEERTLAITVLTAGEASGERHGAGLVFRFV